MAYRKLILVGLAGALMLSAWNAEAWGPRTQVAIVNTALQLMAREQGVFLNRLGNDARAGAAISHAAMEELYPEFSAAPLRALENEVALLTAARGAKIDAYYAWRLGVLGKMVARMTAPMTLAEPDERARYYADADQSVNMGTLASAPRRIVDIVPYMERLVREANAANDLIINEYHVGVGFKGAGASRLAADASRSVNAVADIWWSILATRSVAGNVSEDQLRRFVLGAYAYYIDRGNIGEIEAVDANYAQTVLLTPDARARLGDMFYTAGMFERAVREYEAVLAVAPGRRDVVEKIAAYYFDRAETALKEGRLEDALAGFEKALNANLLHPTAEQRRLETEAHIRDRDALQAKYQASLKRAEEMQELAEAEAGRNRYAESHSLLQQAEAAVKEVGDEFPREAQRRARMLRDIQTRLADFRQALLANIMNFSGSGFARDAADLASQSAAELEMEVLRELVGLEYEKEISALQQRMQPMLAIQ